MKRFILTLISVILMASFCYAGDLCTYTNGNAGPRDTIRIEFTTWDTLAHSADADSIFIRRWYRGALVDSTFGTAATNRQRTGSYSFPMLAAVSNAIGIYSVEIEFHKWTKAYKLPKGFYEVEPRYDSVYAAVVGDKDNYNLAQTFPTNFSSLAITAGGAITVGTNNDKSGYTLASGGLDGVTQSSGSVRVGTNLDKTGYSLTQTFPTNFSSLAITAGGAVTAGTISDKSGYSLASGGLDGVTQASGSVRVGTNLDKTDYVLSQAFPANFASAKITSGGYISPNIGDVYGQFGIGDYLDSWWHNLAQRADSGGVDIYSKRLAEGTGYSADTVFQKLFPENGGSPKDSVQVWEMHGADSVLVATLIYAHPSNPKVTDRITKYTR